MANSWIGRFWQAVAHGSGKSPKIRAGDRYLKLAETLDGVESVWIVSRTVVVEDLPLHVRLWRERPPHVEMTLSMAALEDRNMYRYLGPQRSDYEDRQSPIRGESIPASSTLDPSGAESGVETQAQRPPEDPVFEKKTPLPPPPGPEERRSNATFP